MGTFKRNNMKLLDTPFSTSASWCQKSKPDQEENMGPPLALRTSLKSPSRSTKRPDWRRQHVFGAEKFSFATSPCSLKTLEKFSYGHRIQ